MLDPNPNGECISPVGNFANPNALTLVNNFFVNDNINIGPADFERVTITAPTDREFASAERSDAPDLQHRRHAHERGD